MNCKDKINVSININGPTAIVLVAGIVCTTIIILASEKNGYEFHKDGRKVDILKQK